MCLDLLTGTGHTHTLIVTDRFQSPLYFRELSGPQIFAEERLHFEMDAAILIVT